MLKIRLEVLAAATAARAALYTARKSAARGCGSAEAVQAALAALRKESLALDLIDEVLAA
ncbi:hypothetical protein [Sinimarinibacterium sp. NLF-5-8]|uniref:hypothetical protein n=1 Tax=Sinimarinibacterium sp. NLF-5-8 TaxID=2698684 RepID=UPI00137BE400|nr:hypothetical protein [Sinimarinibacterium sp. NLF-5-8]QHS09063.1 hypothetical protein GT972_02145 [Sinimarinibacterium sp. NLF-5-8]